jgi:hypothetical protein
MTKKIDFEIPSEGTTIEMLGLPGAVYVSEAEAKRMIDQMGNPPPCPWDRTERGWPEPTEEKPTIDEMEMWAFDSVVRATDGCEVEPDGVCPHGHPSWMVKLGII